jgi:hypothetical protein
MVIVASENRGCVRIRSKASWARRRRVELGMGLELARMTRPSMWSSSMSFGVDRCSIASVLEIVRRGAIMRLCIWPMWSEMRTLNSRSRI